MAPVRTKKRTSDAMDDQKVPVRSPTTPHHRSPIKKRKGAISLAQKQALIDNLQLEITERARRLRAQYNLQAQGLRSRIEIRINRIPVSLRKIKMGDLLAKYLEQEEKRSARAAVAPKVLPARANPQRVAQNTTLSVKPAARAQKRMSDAISGDKENSLENAKKRVRGAPTADVRPAQILSPTSSNSRLNRPRPMSPVKSAIARPASPLKSSGTTRATATSVLSNMVEKAKATRAGAARKVTATSNASSSSSGTAPPPRTKRAATTTASRAPASRPATRNARRVSGNSETSEASTGTVVKRGAAAKAAPAKKGVMSSIRKGVTGGTRKAATKAATPAAPAASTGRVLRKRG
ncbi:Borealin N terminal-domain-containing protein [Dactylonectria macrodidyma]|uniref:Borealin N terminal-domain-containing protein n=1 Tax=Dactylonectria macrodidyma TaxID=307937 RepID=A0A9P9FRW2_9HYPO|nr:Borealin N terminal-domain-containing protein [Dactylonectria macrodidyma]